MINRHFMFQMSMIFKLWLCFHYSFRNINLPQKKKHNTMVVALLEKNTINASGTYVLPCLPLPESH